MNVFANRTLQSMSPERVARQVENFFYSPDSVRRAISFRPRKQDVLIVGTPKSGLDLVGELTRMLVYQNSPAKERDAVNVPWLESKWMDEHQGEMPIEWHDDVDRPHLFKTHMTVNTLGIPSTKGKYIFVIRHPSETRVSWFQHLRTIYSMGNDVADFDPLFTANDFVDVPVTLCQTVDSDGKPNVEAIEKYTLDIYRLWKKKYHAKRVLVVCYEHLISDPQEVVHRMSGFLMDDPLPPTSFVTDLLKEARRFGLVLPAVRLKSPTAKQKTFDLDLGQDVVQIEEEVVEDMADRRLEMGAALRVYTYASMVRNELKWRYHVFSVTGIECYEDMYYEIVKRRYPYQKIEKQEIKKRTGCLSALFGSKKKKKRKKAIFSKELKKMDQAKVQNKTKGLHHLDSSRSTGTPSQVSSVGSMGSHKKNSTSRLLLNKSLKGSLKKMPSGSQRFSKKDSKRRVSNKEKQSKEDLKERRKGRKAIKLENMRNQRSGHFTDAFVNLEDLSDDEEMDVSGSMRLFAASCNSDAASFNSDAEFHVKNRSPAVSSSKLASFNSDAEFHVKDRSPAVSSFKLVPAPGSRMSSLMDRLHED